MKRYQKGEAMLVMMVVMLVVGALWGGHGHMGMMGHGNHAPDKSTSSGDQQGAASEHQH